MPATYQTSGAFAANQAGNDTGAASTGIGVSGAVSAVGVPGNFTDDTNPFVCAHIGGGLITGVNSGSNTGQIINGTTVTAGSGYTNGVYNLATTGGGGDAGVVQVTVAGGVLTSAVVINAGGRFTSAPTVTLTGMGAGSGGAVTVTVGYTSNVYALGTSYGTNKRQRRATATGAVANNAAIVAGWLNRSGRAMVSGESAWGVEA